VSSKAYSYLVSGAAIVGALLINLPDPLQILLVLMALDILLGIVVAATRQEVSSHRLWKGIAKKIGTVLLLVALFVSEPVLQFDAMGYAAVFFITHELLSIIEHAVILGVPIPGRIANVLSVLRGNASEQDRAEVQSDPKDSR
jgi:toxin secretion/phage lysis holin